MFGDVTDSAAAGTALATGVKTFDGAVGVDADGNPVENVRERAEANEGGSIDWVAQNRDAAGTLAEALEFDRAVQVALDFADADGETLVVVTADHETGGLTLDSPGPMDVAFLQGITALARAQGPGVRRAITPSPRFPYSPEGPALSCSMPIPFTTRTSAGCCSTP